MENDRVDHEGRAEMLAVLAAALAAVDPGQAVSRQVEIASGALRIGDQRYALDELGRIVVVGAGKAGAPMAAALSRILGAPGSGARLTAGLVNVKHGHVADSHPAQIRIGRAPAEGQAPAGAQSPARAATGAIELNEAGHPVPDTAGQAGAGRMLALLDGLTPADLVIVLLSGGGSALLPVPAAGISLADLGAATATLLACGADITEINAVRKHCSRVQGGQLARLAAPAAIATLVLSDVVGSPLDAIASGPTVPDHSTFADALAVLDRYQIRDRVPGSVLRHLQRGAAGDFADTPKPGDPLFERVNNVVIGDNAIAARAAVAQAQRLGWQACCLTTFLQGEAREVGRALAGLAQGVATGQSDLDAPACLVLGGETTVTLRGDGLGGRNQELALAAALALDGYRALGPSRPITLVTLATDGNDGPTDAAGGLVTHATVEQGRRLGLDAHAALAANNSYHYLSAVESLVFTGPTNTNVNDLTFLFI